MWPALISASRASPLPGSRGGRLMGPGRCSARSCPPPAARARGRGGPAPAPSQRSPRHAVAPVPAAGALYRALQGRGERAGDLGHDVRDHRADGHERDHHAEPFDDGLAALLACAPHAASIPPPQPGDHGPCEASLSGPRGPGARGRAHAPLPRSELRQPPAEATDSLHFGASALISSPACLSPSSTLARLRDLADDLEHRLRARGSRLGLGSELTLLGLRLLGLGLRPCFRWRSDALLASLPSAFCRRPAGPCPPRRWPCRPRPRAPGPARRSRSAACGQRRTPPRRPPARRRVHALVVARRGLRSRAEAASPAWWSAAGSRSSGGAGACFSCACRSALASLAFERSFRPQTPKAIATTATAAVAHSHGLRAAEVRSGALSALGGSGSGAGSGGAGDRWRT